MAKFIHKSEKTNQKFPTDLSFVIIVKKSCRWMILGLIKNLKMAKRCIVNRVPNKCILKNTGKAKKKKRLNFVKNFIHKGLDCVASVKGCYQ